MHVSVLKFTEHVIGDKLQANTTEGRLNKLCETENLKRVDRTNFIPSNVQDDDEVNANSIRSPDE